MLQLLLILFGRGIRLKLLDVPTALICGRRSFIDVVVVVRPKKKTVGSTNPTQKTVEVRARDVRSIVYILSLLGRTNYSLFYHDHQGTLMLSQTKILLLESIQSFTL
jgi:hypothetical protein